MRSTSWGSQGLTASVEGLGAMGMSAFYGPRDDEESTATLNRALDLGVTMVDTAEIYGPFLNEQLIQRALGGRRDEYAVATKFARHVEDDGTVGPPDGSAAYARRALERSLTNLGTEVVDLYYLHRVDPGTPIEETIGAMAEFVQEGKVRYLGVSEAAPDTIRRAHATHPLTAVQTEYSLFQREPEVDGVLDTCRELGIAFVAYSPLGRGVLTGAIASKEDLADGDFRKTNPRFQDESLQHNLAIVEKVKSVAGEVDATPGQVALAWLLHQEGVVTIPGTKRRTYLEENVAAADVTLSDAQLAALDEAAPVGAAQGERYDAAGMKQVSL